MRNILRLVILVSLSTHTANADVRQEVDSLVEKLPAFADESPNYFMEIPESGPVGALLKLGIQAVPFLVPHLSDMRMTQSFRVHGSGKKAQISVNEIIGHVITTSCDHYFYLASGDKVSEYLGDKPIENPETIALYQNQVETWYQHFEHWKESERKLVDVNDWFHYNRFKAYDYFAKNPSSKARLRLSARIQILLTNPGYNSTIASELVSCAEAIVSMGENSDLDLVKRVWTNEFEKPMNTSGREDNVKRLYQARVKLGDKQDAMKAIDAYNLKYSGSFPPIIVE